MNKEELFRKLSSRKLWAAAIGFVTTILTALNINSLTIDQVTAIIGAVGSLVVYILAEAYVDGKGAGATIVYNEQPGIEYGIPYEEGADGIAD